ncbi:MAG: hypothetical protein GX856_09605 [Gammaproteobacteria bacterium]|nr:hypothetical protein [Gammaproteobacteria bacterium]
MSLRELQGRVARAEATLEAQRRRVAADLRVFGRCWNEAWTPPRIIVAGLAAGLLAGWARPARAVAGIEPARWLQLAGSLAGLVGSIQAAFAAGQAQEAAEDADLAATTAAVAAGADGMAEAGAPPEPAPPPSARRFVPDPSWDSPPRPAEAATEVSERR